METKDIVGVVLAAFTDRDPVPIGITCVETYVDAMMEGGIDRADGSQIRTFAYKWLGKENAISKEDLPRVGLEMIAELKQKYPHKYS